VVSTLYPPALPVSLPSPAVRQYPCAQVVEKDRLIAEKESLYAQMKAVFKRQPGPEVAEQLALQEQTLKEKRRQLKARPCARSSRVVRIHIVDAGEHNGSCYWLSCH